MAAVSLGTTSAVGMKANMYSPTFSSAGRQLSVHFWYNTYSSVRSEFGALYVYLDDSGQHGMPVFSSTKGLLVESILKLKYIFISLTVYPFT